MTVKDSTHHHIRRGYHAITFITSVLFVAFFSWILGIALTSVSAQIPSTNTSNLAAPVPDINVISETNTSPEADESADNEVKEPFINAIPADSIQQRYVLKDGDVQPIFIFKNQYPKFIGQTNIKDSTAVLDIFGLHHVTGKSRVDSNGNWMWESTVPLKPGTYTFNVKAVKGTSSKVLAKDSMLFEVVLASDEELEIMKFNNTPTLGNGGVLFDVRAIIPQEYKTIEVGGEIKTEIKFINFGSPNKAVDVEVQYTLRNEENKIVSQNSETMAVKDTLEFTKFFHTSSSLPSGEYALTVAVPSQDLIATATDTFKIKSDNNAAAAGSETKSPFANKTLLYEILGAILFLGIIVAYMEYNKVVVLSRNIKQLTEKDLIKLARR